MFRSLRYRAFYNQNSDAGAGGAGDGGGNGGGNSGGDEKLELTKEELQKKLDDNSAAVRQSTERAMQKKLDDLQKQIDDSKRSQEESTAAEQGKFKELYETTKAELDALKTSSTTTDTSYKALAERVQEQITDEIKDWPDEVKALDPGEESAIESRLDWVKKSRALVEKLKATGAAPNGEHGKGKGKDDDSKLSEKALQKHLDANFSLPEHLRPKT